MEGPRSRSVRCSRRRTSATCRRRCPRFSRPSGSSGKVPPPSPEKSRLRPPLPTGRGGTAAAAQPVLITSGRRLAAGTRKRPSCRFRRQVRPWPIAARRRDSAEGCDDEEHGADEGELAQLDPDVEREERQRSWISGCECGAAARGARAKRRAPRRQAPVVLVLDGVHNRHVPRPCFAAATNRSRSEESGVFIKRADNRRPAVATQTTNPEPCGIHSMGVCLKLLWLKRTDMVAGSSAWIEPKARVTIGIKPEWTAMGPPS